MLGTGKVTTQARQRVEQEKSATQVGTGKTTTENSDRFSWRTCCVCGDDYPSERAELGYKYCLLCGESIAREERKSWTVVQEYSKGGYMFVTASAAATTLKQTNPKQPR